MLSISILFDKTIVDCISSAICDDIKQQIQNLKKEEVDLIERLKQLDQEIQKM